MIQRKLYEDKRFCLKELVKRGKVKFQWRGIDKQIFQIGREDIYTERMRKCFWRRKSRWEIYQIYQIPIDLQYEVVYPHAHS